MPDRAAQDRGDRPEDRDLSIRESALTAGAVVLATVVYFLLPVPGRMREGSWAFLFSGGVLLLGALIALTIHRLLRATAGVRARGLIVLLCCGVLFFAWANVTLAAIPGQFADLHTKVDSVYFSVSTLGTVGFGDVHATGQLARAAVTIEMLFNLVFLGTAVTFVTGILRQRVQTTRQHATEGRSRGSAPRSEPGRDEG
jgi:voltage-gated potassium channel